MERVIRGYGFREHDFLLIGPKIGLIVIEVKSSFFSHRKSFIKEHPHLPDEYVNGLQQLKSVDALIGLLQECMNDTKLETATTRKVLFTPNLERHRFMDWLLDLDKASRARMEMNLADTIQWFREDLINDGKDFRKPPLYSTLKRLLASKSSPNMEDSVTYEMYAPILVGLSSAVVSKNFKIELDRSKILESEMIMKESSRIESQEPRWTRKIVEKETISVELFSKTVVLTEEQARALTGLRRQFIVGAAGTGKTIVLQTKALELFKRGDSVLVLASEAYGRKYRELFETSGSDGRNFDVRSWPSVARSIWHSCKMNIPNRLEWMSQTELCRLIDNILPGVNFGDLWRHDHIFIDDAVDWTPIFGNTFKMTLVCLLILSTAERNHPEKTVWIALDPISYDYGPNRFFDPNAAWMIKNHSEFCMVSLNTVMRCPESVFQAAYDSVHLRWSSFAQPHCGHKIGGAQSSIIRTAMTLMEAFEGLLETLFEAVTALQKDGIRREDMAVITSMTVSHDINLPSRIRSRFDNAVRFENRSGEKRKIPKFDDEHSLAIHEWHEVSSFEWPVVLYAALCSGDLDYRAAAAYQRYRAASRATGKLTEIVWIYLEDDTSIRRRRSVPDVTKVCHHPKKLFLYEQG